jgi:hypothetical protein
VKKNPVPASEITRSSEVSRKVFCLHYGDCLDKAINGGWPNFSCQKCAIDEQKKWSEEEAQIDALRCAAMLGRLAYA